MLRRCLAKNSIHTTRPLVNELYKRPRFDGIVVDHSRRGSDNETGLISRWQMTAQPQGSS
jgi:hypothetical protein